MTRQRSPRWRTAIQLFLAAGVPAGVAAVIVGVVLAPTTPLALDARSAAELAAAAERSSLRPIVLSGGRSRLGRTPAAPAAAGPRPERPVRISIPAAAVEAAVVPVEATATGIEVPPAGDAGWYAAGPRPGEPGRAVVIGHLDAPQGAGLFHRLPGLADGTEVSLVDARGEVHRYSVVGRAQVPKTAFPADEVYGSSRRPVLVLVTCGGAWSRETGYGDNVLVYARSVD